MGKWGSEFSFISSADPRSKDLSLFRISQPSLSFPYDGLSRIALRYVHSAFVNSTNSRVVTVLAKSKSTRVASIKLWNTLSGALVWEKDINSLSERIVGPRFSEDGSTLIICEANSVEIVDARMGQTIKVVRLKFRPSAIAIANHGTSIALVDPRPPAKMEKRAANLEKVTTKEADQLHIVFTSGFSDCQICYISENRSIILAGHVVVGSMKKVFTICWDAESCKPLSHQTWGNHLSTTLDGPIYHVSLSSGDGILMRIADQCPPRGVYAYNDIPDSELEDIYTFITISSSGSKMGEMYKERGDIVHGVTMNQIHFLKDDRFLWTWDGESDNLRLAGRLDRTEAPALISVLAVARHGDFGEDLTIVGNGRHFFEFFGRDQAKTKHNK